MAFLTTGAESKPTLFCIGEVASIGPTAPSKKENSPYLVTPVEITPLGSANQKGRLWITWSPEFFRPGYSPNTEEDAGMKMVYSNNVAREHKGYNPVSSEFGKTQSVGLAHLQGIAGSEAAADELAGKLQTAYSESSDVDTLVEKVDKIFAELVGNTVGYVLKQQWTATSEKNEKGYAVKVRGKYYEVAGFFFPTEKSYKDIVDASERAKKKDPANAPWICFDNTPF